MATDLHLIVSNIRSFHDLTGRRMIAVGAGGGRLIEYARSARRVIAVDRDAAAIDRLLAVVAARGFAERVEALTLDFLCCTAVADVVLFEFCLHQMEQPQRALAHARGLAPAVVVLDHAPGSRWSWYAGEEDLVDRAWNAVGAYPVARKREVAAEQRFEDFAALGAAFATQPETARARIRTLREQRPIVIPMPYRLALLG